MAVSDKNPERSGEPPAEASIGRIAEDVQRAQQNISGAAASASEEIAVHLNRLSGDIASLRDTVATLAKTVTGQIGEAGASVGEDIKSTAKDQAGALLSELETAARRNPLGFVFGAFGIGMLIGLIKGRH